MPIDIDRLTESELLDLNRRIVERLKFLSHMRAHARMLDFSIGDRVEFDTDMGRSVTGTIIRYNRKTVTVASDDGHPWRVSPGLLRSVATDLRASIVPDQPLLPGKANG